MKKENTKHEHSNGEDHPDETTSNIAYALGRTEEWLRNFADAIGVPWAVVALGVAEPLRTKARGSLLGAGHPVRHLRRQTATAGEVGAPEMAVGGDSQNTRTQARKVGRRRKKLHHMTVAAIHLMFQKGEPVSKVRRKFKLGWLVAKRLQKDSRRMSPAA